jgi:hypothetical protein
MRAGDKVVGAKGFEPSTSWSRTRRASQAALRPDSHARLQVKPERSEKLTTTPACHLRPLFNLHTRCPALLTTQFANQSQRMIGRRSVIPKPTSTSVGEGLQRKFQWPPKRAHCLHCSSQKKPPETRVPGGQYLAIAIYLELEAQCELHCTWVG